ncbi:phenylalanine--tRNA ligase subunit beta [soil metagenome]
MKFSLNWLREFVELPANTAELAELLTLAGVEIEGIEERGANFDQVVVAQINESVQHPNADRLSVCQVDDGSGQQRQIVCGAKNYKVGDKVPLALPGAALPNGLKIKASKLRGVESQGMLCSPIELAISEEKDGLLILSPEAKVGAPISSIFPPDTIFDVEITPNRPDLLSYYGLAREVAALRSASFQLAGPGSEQVETLRYDNGVRITALRECPFYSARRIENVTVGPSPDWLRTRIEAAGLRAINNIVDITNFVMLELGQPLHAFDADKLSGGINVRLASGGEKFLALDGKEYSLAEADLMIADEQRAVAIGGVMGGEDTGVTGTTRNVLLESAYFLPSSIRRTARTLNLPSDASYRFERGVDPGMTLRASQRATELIEQIAGGQASPTTEGAGTPLTAPADVTLRYSRANALIGAEVPRAEAAGILTRFGLTEVEQNGDAARWQIPSYRRDLLREVDLIEEIIRAYGINRVEGTRRSIFTAVSAADRRTDFETRLRQRLVALGFSEARTSALIPRHADAFAEGAVELKNPLSEDHVALRPSLLPGLLGVLERNLRAGARCIRVFELGTTFASPDANEQRQLALLCTGALANAVHWRTGERRPLDLFDLKGAVESLALPNGSFRRMEHPQLALAAGIFEGERQIGIIGQLTGPRAADLGATSPVLLAEIELQSLLETERNSAQFRDLEKFPAVSRDIAMIVPATLRHEEVQRVFSSLSEPLLEGAELFDLFAGQENSSVEKGKKSLAYTLTYRDRNRTLTNDEVTVVHTRIRERLKSELGAELRE